MPRLTWGRLVAFFGCAVALLLAISTIDTSEATNTHFQASPEQKNAAEEMVYMLSRGHYQSREINDEFSSQLLDLYLGKLDPWRMYFTQGDIDEFEVYRPLLDNQLKSSDSSAGFEIYAIYLNRIRSYFEYSIDLLDDAENKLDFDKSEYVELDREDSPWFDEQSDQQDYWRKRVKNNLLQLELSGKTREEAIETMTKRYKNRLQRLDQTKGEDVFMAYMNALGAMYDPHTGYFSPRAAEEFDINMSLSLEGIGAVLQTDEEVTKVVRLVPGGPAQKAGELKPGDHILSVGQGEDGEMVDVVGWRIGDVVDLIRGAKGTTVRLEIQPSRAGAAQEVISIVRNRVELEDQAASSQLIEIEHNGQQEKIGVIDLPTFYLDFKGVKNGDKNPRSTSADVKRLVGELKAQGMTSLVIDLRDNGGGSLQEVATMVTMFVGENPAVLIHYNSGQVLSLPQQKSLKDNIIWDGPLGVMINRTSASASEIFAGAMKDYGRAVIMGTNTFGKGTVQTVNQLSHGQIKYTMAKFYRVSGESTQNRGVAPHISFPPVFDATKVGEGILPNALEWDQISPASYPSSSTIDGLTSTLDVRHAERTESNPEFVFLREQYAFTRELAEQTQLPLKADVRKALQESIEQRRLDIENNRRAGLQLPLLASFDELDALDEEKEQKQEETGEALVLHDQAFLEEAGRVLADFQQLKREKMQLVSP